MNVYIGKGLGLPILTLNLFSNLQLLLLIIGIFYGIYFPEKHHLLLKNFGSYLFSVPDIFLLFDSLYHFTILRNNVCYLRYSNIFNPFSQNYA